MRRVYRDRSDEVLHYGQNGVSLDEMPGLRACRATIANDTACQVRGSVLSRAGAADCVASMLPRKPDVMSLTSEVPSGRVAEGAVHDVPLRRRNQLPRGRT